MSYVIELYSRDFLRRALTEGSGDWTGADPLPDEVVAGVIAACEEGGFVATPHPPGFEAFVRQRGGTPSRDLVRDDAEVMASVSVFPGSVSFSVEGTPRAERSVEVCAALGRALAERFGLGYYDGQAGEVVL